MFIALTRVSFDCAQDAIQFGSFCAEIYPIRVICTGCLLDHMNYDHDFSLTAYTVLKMDIP